jgi:hypothetical protein
LVGAAPADHPRQALVEAATPDELAVLIQRVQIGF